MSPVAPARTACGDLAWPAPQAHAFGHVTDDWHAADIWLHTVGDRSATQPSQTVATYRYHLAKLRWFCENVRKVPPSAWSVQDALAFTDFLKAVPVDALCRITGQHYVRLGEAGYTPFRRQPSPTSQLDIRRVAHALFNAWHRAGYIARNPMMFEGTATRRRLDVHRALDVDLYELILRGLARDNTASGFAWQTNLRDRFALGALRELGLRASELVRANMNAFYLLSDPLTRQHYWIFHVAADTAKGNKARHVPVSQALMGMLMQYRAAFGLEALPTASDADALLLSARTTALHIGARPVRSVKTRRYFGAWQTVRTRQGLYRIVKSAITRAADALEQTGQPQLASQLRAASPHWLRHTFAKATLLTGQNVRKWPACSVTPTSTPPCFTRNKLRWIWYAPWSAPHLGQLPGPHPIPVLNRQLERRFSENLQFLAQFFWFHHQNQAVMSYSGPIIKNKLIIKIAT